MSDRERQRHEWRARVDAAAREWQRVGGGPFNLRFCRFMSSRNARFGGEMFAAQEALDATLAAPKPWRKR